MPSVDELKKICSQVRRDIVRMVHAVNSGHPGGSLGCTEFFVSMYFDILKHDPKKFTMDGIGEDLFFLSNGHISPVFYSALAKKLNGDKSFVYSLHGDGELQEGQIWEAAMYAAAKKVDNLISTVDMNG